MVDNTPRIYIQSDIGNATVRSAMVRKPPTNAILSPNVLTSGVYYAPFNTSGIYASGLSPQSTLQVNVKILLEVAPDPTSTLATLAQPSPPCDYEAVRLASNAFSALPVGVPFDENPNGEWFRSVLGTLGALSTSASGINPLFGIIGRGLSLASGVVPTVVDFIRDKDTKKGKSVEEIVIKQPVRANNPKPGGKKDRKKQLIKVAVGKLRK
jgi:hypothetical protein